ncbi:MAG: YidC/Oxa1 family membrane protein insertase [Actinocrinis sp.]
MSLYREHGVSPAAGCLPALVQLPVLGVMYRLFDSRTVAGRPNGLLAHELGGVPLGSRPCCPTARSRPPRSSRSRRVFIWPRRRFGPWPSGRC